MDFELSESAKQELLTLAKKTVENRLNGVTGVEKYEVSDELNFNGGCFVTITKNESLRGCIGNFREDINIAKNVLEMAGSASSSDPRFEPLKKEELSEIKFEISVLSKMFEIDDIEEIKVGRDGLYIVKNLNTGVLLPQVAVAHKWDKETFLAETCRKAGLHGSAWKGENVRIFRFEALVFGE